MRVWSQKIRGEIYHAVFIYDNINGSGWGEDVRELWWWDLYCETIFFLGWRKVNPRLCFILLCRCFQTWKEKEILSLRLCNVFLTFTFLCNFFPWIFISVTCSYFGWFVHRAKQQLLQVFKIARCIRQGFVTSWVYREKKTGDKK